MIRLQVMKLFIESINTGADPIKTFFEQNTRSLCKLDRFFNLKIIFHFPKTMQLTKGVSKFAQNFLYGLAPGLNPPSYRHPML